MKSRVELLRTLRGVNVEVERLLRELQSPMARDLDPETSQARASELLRARDNLIAEIEGLGADANRGGPVVVPLEAIIRKRFI